MGNAYDNASLIVTPNAYKASKIYALKPTDGSGDLSFSRAGSKMRRNSAGLWETIGTNIPPLHYPVGGGCPSWLFEAEATNVIEYSETLQDCSPEDTTITPNAAISPRGTMTAASMLETNVWTNHDIFRFRNVTIGTKYTQSIRVKPNGRTWAVFVFLGVSGGFAYQKVWFNLTGAGSVGTQQAGIDNASIELDSEGYYFIQATATALATVNEAFIVGIADADNNINYAGDITKGLYTWNYQIETGSTATSPIITAGSSATRLKDVPLSIATPLLLNDFSIYMEFNLSKVNQALGYMLFGSIDGAAVSRIYIDNAGNMTFDVGTSYTSIGSSGLAINTDYKICFTRSGTTLKYYRNGSLISTWTVPADIFKLTSFVNAVDGGGDIYKYISLGSFKKSLAYLTALSTTEANELTTL